MNGTWQNITQLIHLDEPIQANLILASHILAQANGNPLTHNRPSEQNACVL